MIVRIVLALFAFNLFTACQDGDVLERSPDVVQEKIQTGSGDSVLRLLVWEGYAPDSAIREFEREMYIKYHRTISLDVEYARESDDFFEALRNQSADLVTLSHHSIKDEKLGYIQNDLLLPPNLENIPNYKDFISTLKYKSYHTDSGFLYSVPIANGPYGLAYNRDIIKEAPQSWSILWDPVFAGKYILGGNEFLYNVAITALAMGYPVNEISNFDTLNNDEFIAKLDYLADNPHHYWYSTDKPGDYEWMHLAVGRGSALKELNRRGHHWEMIYPVEGSLWWIDDYALSIGLADRPFMKKIAEEWINKTLSPEFQLNHIVRELSYYPVVISIKDDLTQDEAFRINPEIFNIYSKEYILQTEYEHRNRNGLELLWMRAYDQK